MADPVVHLTNGVPDSGTGNVTTLGQTLLDGANATHGAKADAKAATTDATPITFMSVFKQISFSIQAAAASLASLVTAIGSTAWDLGLGTGGTRTQRVAVDTGQLSPLGQNTLINSMSVAMSSDFVGINGFMKKEDVASADGDAGIPAMAIQKATPADTAGTDGDYAMLQMSAGKLWTAPIGFMATCSTDITRPADAALYAVNDVLADSTSAPTSGGFTLTGAARKSGGSGIITDIYINSSAVPGTLLQGELHIFDSAPTAGNDNAAWNLSDADSKLRIAIVPFALVADANNSYFHAQNLSIGFTCVGSANLRYLVKVKNAYTPISGEVLTVRAKCIQVD